MCGCVFLLFLALFFSFLDIFGHGYHIKIYESISHFQFAGGTFNTVTGFDKIQCRIMQKSQTSCLVDNISGPCRTVRCAEMLRGQSSDVISLYSMEPASFRTPEKQRQQRNAALPN